MGPIHTHKRPGRVFARLGFFRCEYHRAATGKVGVQLAELTVTTGLGAPSKDLAPPLLPGWLIVYRGPDGRLCGGCDDRIHGTVQACEWVAVRREFDVILTDGQKLRLRMIRSVAKTDASGQVVAAWTTEQHGFNGGK